MLSKVDTIVAPATPPGRGGVAIIRISGPLTKSIAEFFLGKVPKPRYAVFAEFDTLDQGLALYFPAPHSFTGEDVLELHCHGGPAIIDSLLKIILTKGARMARPGEFSERAFLNDKLDLVQAESIADLINASSEQAVRASLRTLQGDFSKKINELVEALIYLRTYIEAALDFAEEEIDFLKDDVLVNQLKDVLIKLADVQSSASQGSLLQEGMTVVISGAPNVGKSSLLNCLSGKDSAIVTDIPGTTRDLLREQIIIDGMPLHIIDTAGLRESDDVVEQEGIRRAHQEIKQADLVLHLVDAKNQENFPSSPLIIRNKIDLTHEQPSIKTEDGITTISISAKNNLGIDLLKNHIKSIAGYQSTNEGIFSARRRHLDALSRAQQFLETALNQLQNRAEGELVAEDLKLAQQALSEITGEFTPDDLLGRIFSSFCIGK